MVNYRVPEQPKARDFECTVCGNIDERKTLLSEVDSQRCKAFMPLPGANIAEQVANSGTVCGGVMRYKRDYSGVHIKPNFRPAWRVDPDSN